MNIDKLSHKQKVAQLIMPRIDFNVPETIDRAQILVKEHEVGGFIIFNGNRDIVTRTIEDLQSISNIPLLFGCDAERGLGQILSDMKLFPFTMSLGAINDEELVYNQARFITGEMKSCGLNLIFAPVADVNSNPENPIINIRSYGDQPELVSDLCAAFIKGSQENGVLACTKHFPGHGRTGVDSHVDLPVLDTKIENLEHLDLIPFKKSIEANVATVMTAHIAFSEIGNGNAATISKKLVSDILRNKLGYKGLVITDSLHMEGIMKLGDQQFLSEHALNAGCDIVLDPLEPLTLIKDLLNTEAEIENLDSKVERILSAKQNYLSKNITNSSGLIQSASELERSIARSSICLLKGNILDIKKAIIFSFDVTQSEDDISKPFLDYLDQNGIELEKRAVDEIDLDAIPNDASIICLLYTTIGAWKKQSTLPDNFKSALTELESLSNNTVLISFGSPYVISGFNGFKTAMCSFDIVEQCQIAAAEAILGKYKPKGKLPVTLNI